MGVYFSHVLIALYCKHSHMITFCPCHYFVLDLIRCTVYKYALGVDIYGVIVYYHSCTGETKYTDAECHYWQLKNINFKHMY